jgi:hypothetical protein
MVLGVDTKTSNPKGKTSPKIAWAAPTALTEHGVEYVKSLPTLQPNGPERLAFFQEYLEDSEAMLATDAYDEFARAPYAEVKALGAQMHREQLLGWIKDPNVSPSRRRLYLTMLGICGQVDDLPILEEMLRSPDRQVRVALDAIIACYVILKGPEGLPLVEDLFLKEEQAEYIDTYSAITALRFLGQESDVVPKARLMEGLRHILDRPKLADLVIPDLARWQDWSVMDKLVQLFKDADEQSSWVRVPVVNYLRACPKPQAKKYLEELAKIDPEAVKRANSFFPVGAPASKPPVAKGDKPAKDDAAGDGDQSTTGAKSTGAKSVGGKGDKDAGGKTGGGEAAPGGKKTSALEGAPDHETVAAADPVAAEPLAAESMERGEVAAVPAPMEPRSPRGVRHAGSRVVPTAAVEEVSRVSVLSGALAAGGIVLLILLLILRGGRAHAAST